MNQFSGAKHNIDSFFKLSMEGAIFERFIIFLFSVKFIMFMPSNFDF